MDEIEFDFNGIILNLIEQKNLLELGIVDYNKCNQILEYEIS